MIEKKKLFSPFFFPRYFTSSASRRITRTTQKNCTRVSSCQRKMSRRWNEARVLRKEFAGFSTLKSIRWNFTQKIAKFNNFYTFQIEKCSSERRHLELRLGQWIHVSSARIRFHSRPAWPAIRN